MHESFATVVEAITELDPAWVAIARGPHAVTWGQLEDRAARLAGALAGSGVRPGERLVVALSGNHAEHLEWELAATKARVVPAAVPARSGTRELAAVLERARPDAVVYARADGDGIERTCARVAPRARLLALEDHEAIVAAHPRAEVVARDGDDPLLWFTGGTTGTPKAVRWRQGVLVSWALTNGFGARGLPVPPTLDALVAAIVEARASGATPVWLPVTPLSHASGLHAANSALLLGGTVVLLEPGPVNGSAVCRAIVEHRVTNLTIAGDPIARRIVTELDGARAQGAPHDLSSLRRVHSSGAMWSAPVKDALLAHGSFECADTVGATEGVGFASVVVSAPGQATTARFGLGPHARVVDAEGRSVPPGAAEPGLLAASHFVADGYDDDPAATARAFPTIDGVVHAVPGDWALHHADGTITLLGRGSGCINTGGEKVWPEEVEEVLKEHPAVTDAVVVGLADDEWGETVAAVVQLDPDVSGGGPGDAELRAWVGARLAPFKRPRRIAVAEVPRDAMGKPDLATARRTLAGAPPLSAPEA